MVPVVPIDLPPGAAREGACRPLDPLLGRGSKGVQPLVD